MLISQLEKLQFGAKVVLWPELGGPITFFVYISMVLRYILHNEEN